MATPNTQHQNFISGYSDAVNALLDARAKLKSFREQDAATGIVAALTVDDFSGSNAHLQPADFPTAFTAMDDLEGMLTDMTKTPAVPTARLTALLKFRP